jgi:hypothetical protein
MDHNALEESQDKRSALSRLPATPPHPWPCEAVSAFEQTPGSAVTSARRPKITMSQLLLWKWRRRARRLVRAATIRRKGPRWELPADWDSILAGHIVGESWREHFLNRSHNWLWPSTEWDALSEWIGSHLDEHRQEISHTADCAQNHVVDILGHGPTQLPDFSSLSWSTDPISGKRWPMVRSEQVPIILSDRCSDIKHLWEIARFQFAPSLGSAYRFTRQEHYAANLRDWIDDFLEKNPSGYGPHWTNPMEAAIRAINWSVGWCLCRPSMSWDEEFVRRFIGSLIEHGRFIAANLEQDHRGINTNHYLADLVGLYALATLLPEWPEAQEWRSLACRELLAESRVQVLPDGFCYESSFGYHRLTFEMWFLFWRLASQQHESGLDELSTSLARMASFSAWNSDDSGKLPSFGDGDDGRLLFWEQLNPWDHSCVCDLAKAAFGHLDVPPRVGRSSRPSYDVAWLLGSEAYQRIENNQPNHPSPREDGPGFTDSRSFRSAGITILRSTHWHVHAFANPVGTGGTGSHKHNDLLSFTATWKSIPIIVDPGTFAYTADPPLRTSLRRTAAHATIVVDGAEQNRFIPRSLFVLREDSDPSIVDFETTPTFGRVLMRHDAYSRLTSPVVVEREIQLERDDEQLIVHDHLGGSGTHLVEVVFPLGDITAQFVDSESVLLAGQIRLDAGPSHRWEVSVIPGWQSRAYGTKSGHRRIVYRAHLQLPANWRFALTPIKEDFAE